MSAIECNQCGALLSGRYHLLGCDTCHARLCPFLSPSSVSSTFLCVPALSNTMYLSSTVLLARFKTVSVLFDHFIASVT